MSVERRIGGVPESPTGLEMFETLALAVFRLCREDREKGKTKKRQGKTRKMKACGDRNARDHAQDSLVLGPSIRLPVVT